MNSSATTRRRVEFKDEHTGRTIRQLTDCPAGARLPYFRLPSYLPDGRILARADPPRSCLLALDPATGEAEPLALDAALLRLRVSDGRAWFLMEKRWSGSRWLWQVDLPAGRPAPLAPVPPDLPGHIEDISSDGRWLIACHREEDLRAYPVPTTRDLRSLQHYFDRPRRGAIWVCDLASGRSTKIFEIEGLCPNHLEASPRDPGLLRYCLDMPESHGQRIWTMRLDGSGRRPIRPQVPGELVTHEFWWADPDYIAYTYQDRRADPTVATHHWAEYAQAETRLGLADLEGREIYLSDPLNSYHSHIFCSPDGRLVSGEGTDHNSFLHAGQFSRQTTRLDLRPLATIHTGYVPFRGQGINCRFSADGQWLVYADRRDGPDRPQQLYAVRVDL